MSIFLSKLLPLLVYPLGLTCILIVLALILHRRPRWQRKILILALLVLLIAGNRWVAMGLTRSLEWRFLPPDQMPNSDVIVVLGGGTNPAQYPRPTVEVNGAGDRIIYAATLYHQGTAERLLLSGGRIDWSKSYTTPAEEMATILEMLGVPREAMWLETESRNTYENAVNCRKILEEHEINRIILVTSALHMPRSVQLFEQQGFEVISAPTDFKVTQANWQSLKEASLVVHLIYFLPSVENISSVSSTMKEYIGISVYWLREKIMDL